MLEAVTGHRSLTKAGIDLVVKTCDLLQPIPDDPEPYEEFLAYFDAVETCFNLEHHLCHAYQAYLASPFDEAAVLTVDGHRCR